MAAELGEPHRRRMAAYGLTPLSALRGLQALERLTSSGQAQAVAVDVDWTTWREAAGRAPPLLAELLPPRPLRTDGVETPSPALLEELATLPERQRRQQLQEFVQAEVSRLLGLADAAALEPGLGFVEAGMDSLMAVELRNRLQRCLGRSLSTSVLFNHPTVHKLSVHLAGLLAPEPAPSTGTAHTSLLPDTAPEPGESPSDEEIARLLAEKYGTSL